MILAVRVIPCLDVDAGRVVKGVNFTDLVDAGDPVEMARVYDAEGADELVFLDITASSGSRETTYDVVRRTAEQVFIPLTVGGGVRSVDDVDRLLRAGADKVGVNTAAIARPELLSEIANRFGSQVLVLSRRRPASGGRLRGDHARRPAGHRHRRGRVGGRGARSWAWARSCSTPWTPTAPRPGTTSRCCARSALSSPSRSSPAAGPGSVERLRAGRAAGADAVLAASVFHFGELRIGDAKAALRDAGIAVR